MKECTEVLEGGGRIYLVLVYDVKVERVNKVNKYLRQYLYWRQNSVFEGELTKSQFNKMISGLKRHIKMDEDSVLIYMYPTKSGLTSYILGVEKGRMESVI